MNRDEPPRQPGMPPKSFANAERAIATAVPNVDAQSLRQWLIDTGRLIPAKPHVHELLAHGITPRTERK